MNPIDIALRIAITAHAGQLDRDGYPVILHPLTVGLMGHTDEEKMAGFLHDVVEDSHYTFQDLLREGIPIGVVNALRLLTHHKETNYYDYVQSIIDSKNPIALQVKYNDLQHNFARGKAYPALQEKHGKALKMVKAAIDECAKTYIYHAPTSLNTEVAIFACGCFWGTQHQFQNSMVLSTHLWATQAAKKSSPPTPMYEIIKRITLKPSSLNITPNKCPTKAFANSSSKFTTPHKPTV